MGSCGVVPSGADCGQNRLRSYTAVRVKPRLHDAAGCPTDCGTSLTIGCIGWLRGLAV